MLSLFKSTATRALDTAVILSGGDTSNRVCSPEGGEPVLSLDVDGLRELIRPLPKFAWRDVVHACASTVSPLYGAVRETVRSDIEHLTQLFVELDTKDVVVDIYGDAVIPESEPLESEPETVSQSSESSSQVRAVSRRRKSTCSHQQGITEQLIIPSSDPSIPTIVITPCPRQERDTSCLVPFQDASFGNRLAVPMHPVVNDVFPPLLAKPSPCVERWRFIDGHWWAVLPSLEEQIQKGMYSRPMQFRRRKGHWDARSRYPSSGNRKAQQQRHPPSCRE
ncbi:hypothetical protein K474DRAFT_1636360 [Panus rudis PR-1116 ss-1]|nr:hypothetical protein K474DRAFT_1636360 [Panus rudis PR-1116 ss-1]